MNIIDKVPVGLVSYQMYPNSTFQLKIQIKELALQYWCCDILQVFYWFRFVCKAESWTCVHALLGTGSVLGLEL